MSIVAELTTQSHPPFHRCNQPGSICQSKTPQNSYDVLAQSQIKRRISVEPIRLPKFAPRPSYMAVQGMMQHEQSSVLKQEHLPPWGLTMEPAAVEMEEAVEAGIVALTFE
jgi:hypothetical protein